MKRKEIVLNGVTFKVKKVSVINLDELERYSGRTLNDCYASPSYAKQYIYKMWEEWAYLNNVEMFGVSGYNGFQFTLQGLVEHEGNVYVLHITKTNNIAYQI